MEVQELLGKMKEVVDEVMLGFQVDFTKHDTDYILSNRAEVPFIWIVREYGTHIYTCCDKNTIARLEDFVNHYDKSASSYLIYVFTGQKFIPVLRCKLMEWVEKLLLTNS